MGPVDIDCDHLVEGSGIGVEHRAGNVLCRIRHQYLDTSEGVHGGLGETLHRVTVGQVEVYGERVTTARSDGSRGLLALGHPSGSEHHRVTDGGEGLSHRLADAGRGSGDHCGANVGIGFEARHQRRVTVVGSAARPRTLIEWTRSIPSGSTS